MAKDSYDWSEHAPEAIALDGKTVDFRVPLLQGGISAGFGKFSARRNKNGALELIIVQTSFNADTRLASVNEVWVPLDERGNIVGNAPGSKSEYSFMAV